MTLNTAGSPRITLHDSGNVSIGNQTDDNGILSITANKGSAGALWTQVGPNNNASLIIQNLSSTDDTNAVLYFANDAGVQAAINARFVDHSTDETQLRFSTHDGSNARERMTLTGVGGLCVGSTLGAAAGGVMATVGDNNSAFLATSSGRTNITLDSNASGGAKTFFRTAGTGNYGSGNGDMYIMRENGGVYLHFDTSALTVSGDLIDTSDVNLKENIVDMGATYGLTTIASLRPRKFDWKEEDKSNGVSGFIAQEVQTVLPNDVNGSPHDEGEPGIGLGINTSGLLAVAVKAIQELKAENDALRARVTTLEG